jgi:O-antigen ligase
VVLLLPLAIGPVRSRVIGAIDAARSGDVNHLLTGRLDGWRAAVHMLGTHPFTGVGQGGFRAEYADARLALMDRGVTFYREQTQVMFDTPHNEFLSVAAEQGWPGVLALLWAVGTIALCTWRLPAGDRLVALAALSALFVVALAWFPFHVAAVAWPWIAALAWIGRRSEETAR